MRTPASLRHRRKFSRNRRVTRPTVLIAGAFGQGNPGDESVLHAFLDALDGCDISVTTARQESGENAGFQAVSSNDRFAVARTALKADLVVVTATVFKTLHPSTNRSRHALLVNTLALTTAARAAGKPPVFAGVGAGSLEDGRAKLLARSIASLAGPVYLRDAESAQVLRDAGVNRPLTVCSDVVWQTLSQTSGANARYGGSTGAGGRTGASGVPRSGDKIVVVLSHLADGPTLTRSLAETLRRLRRDGFEVVVQPWQAEHDDRMTAELVSMIGRPIEIWEPPAKVDQAATQLAAARLVIGLRYHALLAAASAGVSFVAVAHEPKQHAVARRLRQVAVTPDVSPDDLLNATRTALTVPSPSRQEVALERGLANRMLGDVRELAFLRYQ